MPIEWGSVKKSSASASTTSYSSRGIDWSKVGVSQVPEGLPYTQAQIDKPLLFSSTPKFSANPQHKGVTGFLSKLGAGVGNFVNSLGAKVGNVASGSPLGSPSMQKQAGETVGAVTASFKDAQDRFKALHDASYDLASPLELSGKMTEAAMGIVNLMFSPISGVMKGAENLPLIGKVAKPINWTFGKASEYAVKYIEQVKKLTPDSPEKEAVWKSLGPVTKELAGLTAQIALAKIGELSVKAPENYIKETNKATDYLNQVKTRSAIVEIPPEDLFIKRIHSDGIKPTEDILVQRSTGKVLETIKTATQKEDVLTNGYKPSEPLVTVPKAEPTPTESPLLTEARKYKSAEDILKEARNPKADGSLVVGGADIKSDANVVIKKTSDFGKGEGQIRNIEGPGREGSVDFWEGKIRNGERPPVLVIETPGGRLAIADGNNRLLAYKKAGVTEVPVVDNTGGKLSTTPSQLTDIWKQAQKKPVIETPKVQPVEDQKFASRVFERLKAEQPELRGTLNYDPIRMKKDISAAVDLIKKDKQQAYRVAMGVEEPPAGQTQTSVSISLAEKALEEGNNSLYSKLTKNRSLEQTRRGQEISAERGSVTDNSTARYVKEALSAKLERAGKSFLSDLKDPFNKKSNKAKAIERIDREVAKAERKIDVKKLDIKEAQSIIDKLACT